MTKQKITTGGTTNAEQPAAVPGQRKPMESGQFHLQVDRQTKASFATYDAAEKAGREIKAAYPIVRVAVYDTKAGVNTIVELPTA